jgi:AGZA family xanthine/uracil permease-like MFS transporter
MVFTHTAEGITFADLMGLVVIEGIIILVLVLTGFRKAVFHAVPQQLKVAISVGIGLFIALIGFVDARFITRIPDAFQTTVPVQLGADGHLAGWPVLVFCFGLALMVALWVRRVRGAILISIVVTTVVAVVVEAVADLGAASADNPGGWSLSVPTLSGDLVGLPSFDTLGEVNLFGAFGSIEGGALAALLLVFSLLLADFFDTMGTMTAIGAEAGLNDDEAPRPTRSASWWSTRWQRSPVAPRASRPGRCALPPPRPRPTRCRRCWTRRPRRHRRSLPPSRPPGCAARWAGCPRRR